MINGDLAVRDFQLEAGAGARDNYQKRNARPKFNANNARTQNWGKKFKNQVFAIFQLKIEVLL